MGAHHVPDAQDPATHVGSLAQLQLWQFWRLPGGPQLEDPSFAFPIGGSSPDCLLSQYGQSRGAFPQWCQLIKDFSSLCSLNCPFPYTTFSQD